MWKSDRKIYLDSNGNIVPEGDPAIVSLLVDVDGEIPIDVARRYDLAPPLDKEGDGDKDGASEAQTRAASAKESSEAAAPKPGSAQPQPLRTSISSGGEDAPAKPETTPSPAANPSASGKKE